MYGFAFLNLFVQTSSKWSINTWVTIVWPGIYSSGAPKVFIFHKHISKYSVEIAETWLKDLPGNPKGAFLVPILCIMVFTTMESFGRRARPWSRCFMQEAALSAPAVLCQKNQQKFMLHCEQHSHVTVSSSSQKRRVLHDHAMSREYCGQRPDHMVKGVVPY